MSDHSYNIKSCVITNGHQQVIRPMSYGTFNQTKKQCVKNGGIWFSGSDNNATIKGCWGVVKDKKMKHPLLK